MFSANSPPDLAPAPSKIYAFSTTDPLLVSAQLTTKPPLDSAVTEGVSWSPAVVVLTRNSPPTLAPVESNSCPITPRPLGSVWPLWSTQMMTKPPEASFTTFGSDCSPAVAVFARNSPPSRPISFDVVIETPAPTIPAPKRRGRLKVSRRPESPSSNVSGEKHLTLSACELSQAVVRPGGGASAGPPGYAFREFGETFLVVLLRQEVAPGEGDSRTQAASVGGFFHQPTAAICKAPKRRFSVVGTGARLPGRSGRGASCPSPPPLHTPTRAPRQGTSPMISRS